MDLDHTCRCTHYDDEADRPIPVRVVREHRYADTPDGRLRLRYDACVAVTLAVLSIPGLLGWV